MKLSVINKLYEGQMPPKCAPQYVQPTGPTHTPNLGYPKKWTWRKGCIFGRVGSGVPGGCTYCTALWWMKGTYIDFQSMIVSIFGELPQYGILGHVSGGPQNQPFRAYGPKLPFFTKFQVKISQRVNLVQKRSRYGKCSKIFNLSENVAKKGFSHPQHTQNHK